MEELEERDKKTIREPFVLKKKMIILLLLIAVALGSIFGVSKYATDPANHKKTIQSLDDKKTTVLELTAVSAAVSTGITALPGDTGTTLAEKLMDLSSYFLIVLCAIFMEKYLVTITGYATFTFLIPVACAFLAIWLFMKKDILKQLAIKFILIGLAIYFVVPFSVKVSDLIEATYQTSIDETIESAKNMSSSLEEAADDEDATEKNVWDKLDNLWKKAKDTVTNAASTVVEKIGDILNNFIEALAVLIVTSCVIPILVLIFFIWLVKCILGINPEMPLRRK